MAECIYPVLAGEMRKRRIKRDQISDCLGLSAKGLYNKLAGLCPLTLEEARDIRNQFFPNMCIDDLFSREGDSQRQKSEIQIYPKIDAEALEAVVQKAERMNELLKEANSLARELASNEISLKVEIDG